MSNKKNKKKLGYLSTKRIKTNRIYSRKKKEWIERKIKELYETNRKRDKRKFYKDVRNLSILLNVTTLVYNDKGGYMLSEKKNKYREDGKIL